jgi:putative transposase
MPPRALRRLPGCSYVGPRWYFLTILTNSRARFFVDPAVVDSCSAQILRAAAQTRFEISAACYMPDHLHLLVRGTTAEADLLRFVKLAKQLSGFYVKQRYQIRLWGKGYHDRILREDEDLRRYVRYICDNPVKARLVSDPADYPFLFLATSWRDLQVARSPFRSRVFPALLRLIRENFPRIE